MVEDDAEVKTIVQEERVEPNVVTSGMLLQECVTSLFMSWVVLTKFVHIHGSLMNVV